MSKKAAVFFAVWTSFWCSVFNYVYMMIPALKGHPWIMFICLAVFFGMGSTVKDVPVLMASAMCGVFWGQVDLFLMTLGAFGMLWGGFFPIFVGTVITMILHINYLCNTPVRAVPIIFAGVCLGYAAAMMVSGDAAGHGVFAAATVTAALLGAIMKKPLAVTVLLFLCFPVRLFLWIFLAAAAGSFFTGAKSPVKKE